MNPKSILNLLCKNFDQLQYDIKTIITSEEINFDNRRNNLDKFQNALDKSVPIHDLDIKRWAVKARDDCNLSQHLFKTSLKWIHNFKIRYRISRKINKFVTQAQIANKEELRGKANEFVENVKSKIALIEKDNVYNSDQFQFGNACKTYIILHRNIKS